MSDNEMMSSNEQKLLMLRVQLYTAMQQLKGEELERFWKLIDEIEGCRPVFDEEQWSTHDHP